MENHAIQPANGETCLNCGQALAGNYCGACGQEVKDLRRPFLRLSAEALHSLFEIDGRAYRTLFYLTTKPAHLSREYFSGRRTRYTPPLRLFLVISVGFFLLVSFYTAIQSLEGAISEQTTSASAEVQSASVEDEPESTEDSGLEDIREFIEVVNLPFLDAQTNASLRAVMQVQAESNFTALMEDPAEFARGYLEYITVFMLLMMPILALIQKILYFRTGHYYSEHLVLTLHNHTFIIIVLFVTSLTGMVAESQVPILSTVFDILGSIIFLWLWVYLYLSLKNYFQQGHGLTLLKFSCATLLYGLVISTGVLIFSAILFFLF